MAVDEGFISNTSPPFLSALVLRLVLQTRPRIAYASEQPIVFMYLIVP